MGFDLKGQRDGKKITPEALGVELSSIFERGRKACSGEESEEADNERETSSKGREKRLEGERNSFRKLRERFTGCWLRGEYYE